ncbi:MAG: hypothetical protein K2I03_08400 [Lachnospiraceae bacterium]|nr:hypothetical protein [Lachnospiraceae bacterium]
MPEKKADEIVIRFTAKIDVFKKAMNEMQNKLKKTTSVFEGVSGDIKRASESTNTNIRKIGKALNNEVKNFNKARDNVKRCSQTMQELGQKYDMAAAKCTNLNSRISKQENTVNTMRNAYDAMKKVITDFNINTSILEEMESLKRKLNENKNKALELENAMSRLSGSGYDVGFVGDSAMNMEQMKQALNAIDAESEEAWGRLEKLEDAAEGVDREFLQLGSRSGLSNLKNQISSGEEKLNSLRRAAGSTASQMTGLNNRIRQAGARLDQARASTQQATDRIRSLRSSLGSLSSSTHGEFIAGMSAKMQKVGNAAATLIHKFKNATSKVKGFASSVKTAASKLNIFNRHSKKTASLSSGLSSSLKRVTRRFKMLVMSLMFMALLNSIGESFKALSKQSDRMNRALSQLKSSFAYLKNSIVAAFEPVLSYVAPIMSSLVNTVADAVNKMAELFASLAGQKTYTKAVYVQKDFAASLDDASDSAEKAAEANEKLKNSVMGFDEINKPNDPNDGTDKSGNKDSDDYNGVWKTEKVDVSSGIAESIKNGDWSAVGKALADKINGVLGSINWDSVKKKVNGIAKNIADFLNGAISGLDWSLVGTTLGQSINTILGGIDTFLTTFDFGKFGTSMAQMLNSAFSTTDWSLAGKTVGDAVQGVIDTAFGFVETFNWPGVGKSLADAINGCFGAIDFSKAGKTLGDAVKGIFKSITTFFEEVDWGAIGKDIVDFITGIDWIGIITEALKAVFAVAGALVDLVAGILTGIIDAMRTTDWTEVADEMWKMIKSAWNGLTGLVVKIGCAISDTAESLWELLKQGWDNLKECALAIGCAISTKASELWDKIKKGWSDIKDKVLETTANLIMKAKQTVADIGNWFKKRAEKWKDKVSNLAMKAKQTVSQIMQACNNRLKKWKGKVSNLAMKAKQTVSQIMQACNNRLKKWKGKVSNLAMKAKQTASQIMQACNNRLKKWKGKASNLAMKAKQTASDVAGWFEKRASKWKDKAVSFTIKAVTKLKEIKDAFKQAINTVIGWINTYIIDNLNRLSITVGPIEVAGKRLLDQHTFGFNLNHIGLFADGGFPTKGELFIANENGPEMVGTMGGRTTVANNRQIVEGIESGVYRAVKAAVSGNGNRQAIYVYIGGKQLTDYVIKDIKNMTLSTGINPISF